MIKGVNFINPFTVELFLYKNTYLQYLLLLMLTNIITTMFMVT